MISSARRRSTSSSSTRTSVRTPAPRSPRSSRKGLPKRPRPRTDQQRRRHEELPRSRRRRADQPRRALVRHLLAAAQGADRVPRDADRRRRRQPHHGPAPAPGVRGSRQGHQPVHQLARRGHHVAVRDLRHDAVHQAGRLDDLHGAGGLGGRGARARRDQGQALRAARTRGSSSTSRTAARRARRSTSRSRPRRSPGTASCSRSSSPSTRASRSRRSAKDTDRDYILTADEAVDYGVVDEVITSRKIKPELAAAAAGSS